MGGYSMFNVDKEKCITCKQCINDCPVNDIVLKDNKAHEKMNVV